MSDFIQLLRESIPEAIGALATAAILAILGFLYNRWSRREKKKSAIIGEVFDILPVFLLRLFFPVSKVARRVKIDLRSENPIYPRLDAEVPRISLWFTIANLSHLNLVLDRLLLELWFGQPTLRGAILKRYPLAASSVVSGIYYTTGLTIAQKRQIEAYLSSPSSYGAINLHVTGYLDSKLGVLEVEQTFERRNL